MSAVSVIIALDVPVSVIVPIAFVIVLVVLTVRLPVRLIVGVLVPVRTPVVAETVSTPVCVHAPLQVTVPVTVRVPVPSAVVGAAPNGHTTPAEIVTEKFPAPLIPTRLSVKFPGSNVLAAVMVIVPPFALQVGLFVRVKLPARDQIPLVAVIDPEDEFTVTAVVDIVADDPV